MVMKVMRIISIFSLLTLLFSVLLVPGAVLAQDEEEGNPEKAFLTTEFPSIQGQATDTFNYNVVIHYTSKDSRVFDLHPSAPAGWTTYVTPQYDSTKLSSISAEAAPFSGTKSIKLVATPPVYPFAPPGKYTISLEVVSESLKATIDVTAEVLPKGTLNAIPANEDGRYNTHAKSGKDNIYSIIVTNTGTSAVKNVSFTTSNKPDGWDVSFNPDKIESLEVLDAKTIDVNIKPQSNTASGDYMLSLRVTGEGITSAVNMDVRVIVETSTIWGWVGVIIIIIVIIGLFTIFMRFGRR
jgi:uncharacterized membrane protein